MTRRMDAPSKPNPGFPQYKCEDLKIDKLWEQKMCDCMLQSKKNPPDYGLCGTTCYDWVRFIKICAYNRRWKAWLDHLWHCGTFLEGDPVFLP
jgi:hypothetical protein